MLNLDAFIALASSANLRAAFCRAKPYGGWESAKDLSRHLLGLAEEAVDEGLDYDELLDEELQTMVVVAVDEYGRIFGAWSPVSWTLGSTVIPNADAAYRSVFA